MAQRTEAIAASCHRVDHDLANGDRAAVASVTRSAATAAGSATPGGDWTGGSTAVIADGAPPSTTPMDR